MPSIAAVAGAALIASAMGLGGCTVVAVGVLGGDTAVVHGAGPAPMAPGTSAPALRPAIEAQDRAAAAACPGLPWEVLAAVGLEAVDGRAAGPVARLAGRPEALAGALCAAGANSPGALAGALGGLEATPVAAHAADGMAQALTTDPGLGEGPATALAFAAGQLGTPYRWGGTGDGGYDCSGLVQAAYRAAGVALPRVAQDQFDAGPAVPAGEPVEPGDLVFFGAAADAVEHVGIYVGAGEMIDAPYTGTVVRLDPAAVAGFVGATSPGE
jgi:cell wall-associated NlpC family hydrolase